ncbi:unnamed protein product [Cylicocyclus nassatus]|uniref:Uncharacterized protein n=1 Tax=Cylicocyclus nassatus TaxID=53992 RepID=A0AA36HBS7_CYLNA|nr:unnamed protein product [Cylicocyclus nassatus]
MLPIVLLLIALTHPTLQNRFKRLSAYDPANLLLPQRREDVPAYRIRPYRPRLRVVLAEVTKKFNGKEIPIWLGDGFVRIPKRPVLSRAQVIEDSAEQGIEVHFGGGSRPHYPYPRVPAPYRPTEWKTTTYPPVMYTLGPGRVPPAREPFKAEMEKVVPLKQPYMGTDSLIIFKKKKRPHH